jgi:hypothetical protein
MNSRYDASRYVCATISFSGARSSGKRGKLERVNRIMNEFGVTRSFATMR